jgi:hypothetical protein
MAWVEVDELDVVVRLGAAERTLALRGDIRIPRHQLDRVRHAENLWKETRGLRIGIWVPAVMMLCTTLHSEGRDFVAVYGREPGIVLEFRPGARFRRILLTQQDATIVQGLLAPTPA